MLVAVAIETARMLAGVVSGRKFYAFSLEKVAELVAETQPKLVLLGARIQRSGKRAVEQIPALKRASPGTAFVLLTHRPSRDEIAEALALGAFGTVDLEDEWWDRRLDRIISSAERHHRAGRRGSPPSAAPIH